MFNLAVPSELLAITGAGVSTLYLSWRHARRPIGPRPIVNEHRQRQVLGMQAKFGYNEHSFVSVAVQPDVWFDPSGNGAVSYIENGRVWLVGGEPLADDSNLLQVTRAFLKEARKRRKLVAFLPSTERFANVVAGENVRVVKVGASPYFDLQKWDPRGNSAKKLRLGVNRAHRAGLVVEQVDEITETFRAEVEKLSGEWSGSRRAGVGFGWLFGVMPFSEAASKRYFSARTPEGTLVGVLAASPIPAREGWYLEDVLRSPQAPDGTSDLLVSEALKSLAAQGAKLATLGTVPLSEKGSVGLSVGNNKIVERALKVSRKRLNKLYNFEGLGHFKSKFVPCWWENEYVIVTKGHVMPPRVANAVFNVLLPGGLIQILRILLSDNGS